MSPRRHPVAKRSLISQIFEKMMNFQKNLVFFRKFLGTDSDSCQTGVNPFPRTHTLIIIELVKLPKLCLTEYNWPSLFKHIYFIVIGFDVKPADRWRCSQN